MMKALRPFLAIALLAVLLGGCASGAKHAEVASAIPPLKPGMGRIYFLRSSAPMSMFGAAWQPEVRLNRQVVGRSRPGGFFFVDRPPGPYRITAETEVTMALDITLYPNEVKYVRSEPSVGLLIARIGFSLMDADDAQEELAGMSYTGRPLGAAMPMAPAPAPAPAAPEMPAPR